ncbi:UDP-N-acetylmuramate--L-alanine ligase [Candidatus Kaiserbacteria bacterium]|nr:UDP-N-acetylmuramate--L-alanine ligase [Candidatus Kaiserbacteria bacterium]
MARVQLEKKSRIHFIGIGGIGMSALARFMVAEKKHVSGSDRALTPLTKTLVAEGITVMSPQSPDNITKDIELVVYTEAVTEGSEGWAELERAKELRIPCVNLFEADGLAFNPYYLIAVAGTHGKTTTTAMITDIFEAAEKDPTAIIGSLRAKTKSNMRYGKSKYAIIEACEYKKDFLHLTPDVLVITNIELDHVDFYKDLAAVQDAFRELIERVNEDGIIVADVSDPAVAPVLQGCTKKIIDYKQFLDLNLKLKLPGIHNRLNAAAALAAASTQKIAPEMAREALEQFAGTWRRFEYKGDCNGAPVYDDYAHHPTAISLTVAAARELYPDKRVTIIFEPHTYSRTAQLFNEFAKALATADRVILLPIFAAREENKWGVSSRELAVKTLEHTRNVRFATNPDEVATDLKHTLTDHDVVIAMGAGKDVSPLAEELTK